MDLIGLNNCKIKWKLLLMVSALAVDSVSTNIRDEVYKSSQLFARMTQERSNEYFLSREGDAKLLTESRVMREGNEQLNTFNLTDREEIEINRDFEYLLNVVLEKYDCTDIVLTNKYKEVIFSMNYELLDMAPLTATGDFVD